MNTDREGNAMGAEGSSLQYRAGVAECASDVVEGLPPRYLAGEARDNARAFAAEGDEGGTRFWIGYADAARLWERGNG